MTQAAQLAAYGSQGVSLGFKNRIINGDMRIDQRNNGASVVNPSSTAYYLDRWNTYATQSSKYTIQQNAGSVTPPVGFTNYLGVTSSSAFSSTASDQFVLRQAVEGFNVSDFGLGTSNAITVTLSFWVRSSLTGTFCAAILNNDGNRSYVATYNINSANSWEYKTITIPLDTTGTWLSGNLRALSIAFDLGSGTNYNTTSNTWQSGNYFRTSGSQSIVGTNGATFYITGVQLEKGSTATSFDFRPYQIELDLCKRYYQQRGASIAQWTSIAESGQLGSATGFQASIRFSPPMRVAPSTSYTGAVSNIKLIRATSIFDLTSLGIYDNASGETLLIIGGVSNTAGAAGEQIRLQTNSVGTYITFSAEL